MTHWELRTPNGNPGPPTHANEAWKTGFLSPTPFHRPCKNDAKINIHAFTRQRLRHRPGAAPPAATHTRPLLPTTLP